MTGQRKKAAPRAPRKAPPRFIFTAAVRYRDGRRELIRVKNVDDIADARALLFDELMDIQSAVIACQ